jgi:hypothetical protein
LCNLARSNRASIEPLESGNNVAGSSSRRKKTYEEIDFCFGSSTRLSLVLFPDAPKTKTDLP